VASLAAAGAFAGAFAVVFFGVFAGAFAGTVAVAGTEGFAGDGAGVCGALGVWDPLETGFDNWSRTAFGWTFGCSCAKAHVARTADKASGKRVRDDFASRIVIRLDSAYLRTG